MCYKRPFLDRNTVQCLRAKGMPSKVKITGLKESSAHSTGIIMLELEATRTLPVQESHIFVTLHNIPL